tara:strand:+ start:67 stop:486 length:420 start_codon:yes stop_codon:yes gene_type:complete
MGSRSTAFLLPVISLDIGVPVVDKRGNKGVVVDVWFSKDENTNKVKVSRSLKYDATVKTQVYFSYELRVDLSTDIGYVYVLREYLRLANAKVKEDTKPYAWTWGNMQEQAFKFWANTLSIKDEKRLADRLIKITQTEEH